MEKATGMRNFYDSEEQIKLSFDLLALPSTISLPITNLFFPSGFFSTQLPQISFSFFVPF